jgi:hypothetical protein
MNLVEINLIYLIEKDILIIPYIISINNLEIKFFPLLILELIVILLLI